MKPLDNLLSIHARSGGDGLASVTDAMRDYSHSELRRVVEAATGRVESFAGISNPSEDDATTVSGLADILEAANTVFRRREHAADSEEVENSRRSHSRCEHSDEDEDEDDGEHSSRSSRSENAHARDGVDEKRPDRHRKESELGEANDKYGRSENRRRRHDDEDDEDFRSHARNEHADDEDDEEEMRREHARDRHDDAEAERQEHSRRAPVALGMLPSDRKNLTATRGGKDRSYTILAAADIPNISTGAELDGMTGLAEAAHSRLMGMSRLGEGKTMTAGIATIRRHMPEELVAKDESDWKVIDTAFDVSRLPANALTAAGGGWCAPSEVLYDLCPTASLDGLLDHPTIQVRRGGLRWPSTPDFSSVYCSTGFNQTEAQAQAGTPKPCTDIPCPPFNEARMNALGLCVRGSILSNQAYPEMTRYFVEQALIAHAHQVNQWTIAQMASLATPVHFQNTGTAPAVATAYGPGAFSSIMDVLEITWQDLVYKYRFPMDMQLEVVAPAWVEPLIRSDLSKRTGWDALSMSDAQIKAYFAARNLRIQYVYDWFDALGSSTSGTCPATTGFGAATPQMTYPGTVPFLVYPAGTYIIGVSDVITIDGLYDSTNLTTNNYTAIFTEEGRLVGKRCFESRLVTVDVCANGMSGGYIAYPPASGNTVTLTCPAA